VPGVAPDDVEITVLGDTVRIRGERREQRQEGGEGQRWLMREQRYGMFERVIRLPSPVKADAAQAEFKDGILTVRPDRPRTCRSRQEQPVRSKIDANQRDLRPSLTASRQLPVIDRPTDPISP
jgi:HSP20 family protein